MVGPDGEYAYVLFGSSMPEIVPEIKKTRLRDFASVDVTNEEGMALEGWPSSLAIDPSGKFAYVSTTGSTVLKIRLK